MNNIIKKIVLLGVGVVFGTIIFAMPAMASTVASLSPVNVNTNAGKSFTVSVSINPQGASNFTEKLEIDFPANILEATSFSFGNSWMALTQPGYDTIDNVNGVLIKTAGYPAGFSGATTFGTITFYAKKAGNGTIKVGNSSIAFEVNSQSAISGNEITLNVNTASSKPANQTTTSISPKATSTPINTEIATSQTAVINTVISNENAAIWARILVVLIIIAIISYAIYASRKNKGDIK
jgi:hypothetical protein